MGTEEGKAKSWKWAMNRTQQQRDEFTSPDQMQEMQMMQGGSGVTFGQEEEVQVEEQGGDLMLNRSTITLCSSNTDAQRNVRGIRVTVQCC